MVILNQLSFFRNKLSSLATQLVFSYSNLTIETLEQGVKYVNYVKYVCSSVSIVNFEHATADWITIV